MNTRETEFERQLWRETLYQSLAREGNEDSADHTSHFDRLVDNGLSGETACQLLYNAYGSGVSEFLERQMRQYSQNHAGIPTQNRLAALIKRYNKNISTLAGISVNLAGKNLTLTDEELENCKINNMNHCLKAAETHTATASTKSNPKNRGCEKLVIEVKYF